MAKVLKEFDFSAAQKRPSPYDKFLDGQIWQLTLEDANEAKLAKVSGKGAGISFSNLKQFRVALSQRARILEKKMVSAFVDDTIVVQAFDSKKEA